MEWLFIALPISAIIGGMFGAARGRVGAGVFLSLLLGPIGWAIIFFGSDERDRCVHCKGVIQSGATVCKHCGRTPFITASAYHKQREQWEKIKDPVDAWEADQKKKDQE